MPKLKKFETISASSISTFLYCPRQWWFKYVLGHRPPSTTSMEHGTRVHTDIEEYLAGEKPEPDTVEAIEAKSRGMIPKPELIHPDCIEMDASELGLEIHGKRFLGYLDLVFDKSGPLELMRDGDTLRVIPPDQVRVRDWKTRSSFSYAPDPEGLLEDTQARLYAWFGFEICGPEVEEIIFGHGNMIRVDHKRGRDTPRSNLVETTFRREDVYPWIEGPLKTIVHKMEHVAREESAKHVKKTDHERGCYKYGPCYFQENPIGELRGRSCHDIKYRPLKETAPTHQEDRKMGLKDLIAKKKAAKEAKESAEPDTPEYFCGFSPDSFEDFEATRAKVGDVIASVDGLDEDKIEDMINAGDVEIVDLEEIDGEDLTSAFSALLESQNDQESEAPDEAGSDLTGLERAKRDFLAEVDDFKLADYGLSHADKRRFVKFRAAEIKKTQADTEEKVQSPNPPDAAPDQEPKALDEIACRDFDFQSVAGVGASTEENIRAYVNEQGVERLIDLLDHDLTEVAGVGGKTAESLKTEIAACKLWTPDSDDLCRLAERAIEEGESTAIYREAMSPEVRAAFDQWAEESVSETAPQTDFEEHPKQAPQASEADEADPVETGNEDDENPAPESDGDPVRVLFIDCTPARTDRIAPPVDASRVLAPYKAMIADEEDTRYWSAGQYGSGRKLLVDAVLEDPSGLEDKSLIVRSQDEGMAQLLPEIESMFDVIVQG